MYPLPVITAPTWRREQVARLANARATSMYVWSIVGLVITLIVQRINQAHEL